MQKKNKSRFRAGFTLIEVLIALGIAAFLFTWAAGLYLNVVGGSNKVQLERELFENGRYVLERVVSDFRVGTVDYAEYWNKSREDRLDCGYNIEKANGAENNDHDVNNDGKIMDYENEIYSGYADDSDYTEVNGHADMAEQYGNCHVFYEAGFWTRGTIGDTEGRDEATDGAYGKRNYFDQKNDDNETVVNADDRADAISDYLDFDNNGSNDMWQEELYLINAEGNEKTIIRRRTNLGNKCYGVAERTRVERNDDSVNIADLEYCRVEMLKMDGEDTDSDGLVDSWEAADGYDYFVPISPPSVDVLDLRFFISPGEDPNLAYDEELFKQVHPHVTVLYSAQVNPRETAMMDGDFPQMTVQTTVSSRVYYNDK